MEHKHVEETHGTPVFCQSCGMPMPTEELFGTNEEGNKIEEYCVYCYEAGAFKQPDITMQEMADICTGILVEEGMDEQAARKLITQQLPHLKRWSVQADIPAAH